MRITHIISILLIFFISFLSNSAFALTISASASGSVELETVLYPDTITNGDFLISQPNGSATIIGDGINERTNWTFDFTSDPFFDLFLTDSPLTSALFTLTLTPYSKLITTDAVRIEGLSKIKDEIQALPVHETATVEIELLDYYTSDEILGKLSGNDNGYIPMFYHDDAIVSYAQLDLSNTVPEPSTLFLTWPSNSRLDPECFKIGE